MRAPGPQPGRAPRLRGAQRGAGRGSPHTACPSPASPPLARPLLTASCPCFLHFRTRPEQPRSTRQAWDARMADPELPQGRAFPKCRARQDRPLPALVSASFFTPPTGKRPPSDNSSVAEDGGSKGRPETPAEWGGRLGDEVGVLAAGTAGGGREDPQRPSHNVIAHASGGGAGLRNCGAGPGLYTCSRSRGGARQRRGSLKDSLGSQ